MVLFLALDFCLDFEFCWDEVDDEPELELELSESELEPEELLLSLPELVSLVFFLTFSSRLFSRLICSTCLLGFTPLSLRSLLRISPSLLSSETSSLSRPGISLFLVCWKGYLEWDSERGSFKNAGVFWISSER